MPVVVRIIFSAVFDNVEPTNRSAQRRPISMRIIPIHRTSLLRRAVNVRHRPRPFPLRPEKRHRNRRLPSWIISPHRSRTGLIHKTTRACLKRHRRDIRAANSSYRSRQRRKNCGSPITRCLSACVATKRPSRCSIVGIIVGTVVAWCAKDVQRI